MDNNNLFEFEKIDLANDDFGIFTEIGKKWLLIGCEDAEKGKTNLMTASWGMMGVLWGKPVCTLFVRPQRYTNGLIDKSEFLTAAVFDEKYRDKLSLCGTKSGRDTDKVGECGFTQLKYGNFYSVEEAEKIYLLKKIYKDKIKPENMIDEAVDGKCYPLKDYHYVYICEIVGVLTEKNK